MATTPDQILVAIEERSYYDIPAYHAHCMRCDWRCYQDKGHDGAHAKEATAVKHAQGHLCEDIAQGFIDAATQGDGTDG